MISSYRDLIVWEKSYKLSLNVYKITKNFPNEETCGLVSQMRRCAVSIPSNIAEGCSRQMKKEYIRFLRISFASGAELETQLLLSRDLNYLSNLEYEDLNKLLEEVMKMLNSLIRKLNTSS